MSRLFVAVWPPPALTEQLRAMERPTRPGLRWTAEDQWHLTLRFLGEVDAEAEPGLRRALGAVAAGAVAAVASAWPWPRALGRSVWIVPVRGLEAMARSVCDATAGIGRPVPDRPFRGHVTLARARRPGALDGLPACPVAAQWTVTDLTLVRSELTAQRARYHIVGSWPVGGDPG